MTTFVELCDVIAKVGTVPCHSAPDIYFVDDDNPSHLVLQKYAKSLCTDCPVLNLCADYALTNGEAHGVWGGMDSRDRNAIRRKLNSPVPVQERV